MRPLAHARPRPLAGIAVTVLAVAAATGAIYPLKHVAPPVSLSVVYLPAVLLVSAYWGLALGLGASLLSAAAFNFFHLPPTGRFTISDSRNWVALGAFITIAAVVSTIAELARGRALEAERRRAEADLAAALARELLSGSATADALGATARRVAEALAIPSAAIELVTSPDDSSAGDKRARKASSRADERDERRRPFALREASGDQIGTLLVPRGLPAETVERLRGQVVPALEALVAIALRRDALQAEAVETAALRRSDDVKTALLRAVSHDLRTPLTAIVAAGHALGGSSLSDAERAELSAAVVGEGERLATLVDKLLDLSRLQAGSAEPRLDWVSLEEVVMSAGDASPQVRVAVDPDVPEVRADAAQLERAFANLLENARRYSNGEPVHVHARRSGSNVVVTVVDSGPGIRSADMGRIFEPFYRGRQAGEPWSGSGLGLAIAKGFIEGNGGTIAVDSLPGQGTSFVITLPIGERTAT